MGRESECKLDTVTILLSKLQSQSRMVIQEGIVPNNFTASNATQLLSTLYFFIMNVRSIVPCYHFYQLS